jgi:glyoxylate reductase
MLVDVVDAQLLAHADRLRVVANVAVGYNNIDIAAARARGIVVTNTPDVLTDATADIAWALILDITRRVSEGDRLVRAGGWTGWGLEFMLGTSLAGKQLGIVGMGRIGRAVAAGGRVFGMRVAYGQRDPSRPGEREATPLSLERLLETSDVVSLHCR